jgi:hypothetical protein
MAERAQRCGTALDVGSFVFSNAADGSEPWYPDSMSRSFERLCAAEGLTGVRLHDLRHFVATQLLNAGVDVRTVAGRLGHRNAATTLNVYAHFLEDSDRAAADISVASSPERPRRATSDDMPTTTHRESARSGQSALPSLGCEMYDVPSY